ncbi:MAG: NAD-dependent DNA ligase LigA, partial [Proteobacteria bacterium]|nr:NAD-dependent DNA ligase LigA [Pseudomonadota bacterium]
LMELEGMGEKSVANLLQAIDASKTIPLNQFIYGLGIRHIGEKAAKMLAIKTGSAERFLSLTEEELETVPDFGPIMAASLVQWLGNEKNGAVVGRLIDLGLAPTPLAIQTNQPFIGKSVVITGTLSKPRREWKRQLENAGFQVSSAVSKKTNYLLAGENAGSKSKKAAQLCIPTLSEAEMEELLAGSA